MWSSVPTREVLKYMHNCSIYDVLFLVWSNTSYLLCLLVKNSHHITTRTYIKCIQIYSKNWNILCMIIRRNETKGTVHWWIVGIETRLVLPTPFIFGRAVPRCKNLLIHDILFLNWCAFSVWIICISTLVCVC